MSAVEILLVLQQVLSGLQFLHSHGVVHRNILARNVLIESVDPLRVVLSDLSVAHRLHAFSEGHSHDLDATSQCDMLTGGAALSPLQVPSASRSRL